MIDDGLVLADVSARSVQHETTFGVDLQLVRAPEAEHDLVRVRAGRDDEVVLELTLVPVVDEVDTRIDVAVLDLWIGGHVGAPLRAILADEVIRLAGELVEPGHHGLARSAH